MRVFIANPDECDVLRIVFPRLKQKLTFGKLASVNGVTMKQEYSKSKVIPKTLDSVIFQNSV